MTFERTRNALTTLSVAMSLAVCIAGCMAQGGAPGDEDEPIGSVQSALQSSCGLLKSGEALMNTYAPAIEAKACGGSLTLDMQKDGNLVLYRHLQWADKYNKWSDDRSVWATATNGRGVAVIMQRDGNLTLVDDHWDVIWQTNTGGHPGAELHLQDDGNMFLWWNNQNIWSARTWDGIDGTKTQWIDYCDEPRLKRCYDLAVSIDLFGWGNEVTCGLSPICIPMLVEWKNNCTGNWAGHDYSCQVVSYSRECHSNTWPATAHGECYGLGDERK